MPHSPVIMSARYTLQNHPAFGDPLS